MPNPQNFSTIIGPSFNQFLPQMSVLECLDVVQYLAHQTAGLLGDLNMDANATGPVEHIATIDQVMAYDPAFYPTPPVIRSLSVNPRNSGSISLRWGDPVNRTGAPQWVTAASNPQVLFNSIFGTGNAGVPRDSGIIDSVYEDYRSLQSHPRLSTADKRTVDNHVSYLADLRTRLTNGAACSGVTRPASVSLWDDPTSTQLRTVSQLLVDVIVAALRCGMTRIATFRMSNIMEVSDFHDEAHACNVVSNQALIVARHQWFAQNVLLYLLQRMDAVEEGNGKTLLENSVVMWGPENLVPHTNKSQITFLWGKAAGRLASAGKHIDYADRNTTYQNGAIWVGNTRERVLKPGYLYNRLMTSLLQMMGVPPERYEVPRTGNYIHGGYGPVWPTQSSWSPDMTSDFLLMSNFYPTQLANMNTPLPMLLA
jgi:hypothetical protein